jgi:DNA replication protein DnaC
MAGEEADLEANSEADSQELHVAPAFAAQPAPPRHSVQTVLNPQCPICGGTGFVVPDVPIGHPDFGKAIPCRCREDARLHKRLDALHAVSNLDLLAHLTFATFIAEPSHLSGDRARNLHRAYDTCYYYAQEPEGWLLLTGTFGCGKTHLAAAIANHRLAMGEPVVFMVVPDLLDHLRATFNPQSPVSYDSLFEQLRSTPLLILDDLGTQSSTPWAQEKLFQLLNYRYNARLHTVITTNQRLEELEPRLRSRLIDPNLVSHFPIIAPDFRAGKNPSQSDLSTLALHHDQRFDTFDARREGLAAEERLNLQEVATACEHYARNPHGWIVLAGANGCGKTHLAAAIANHLVSNHFGDVMFVVTPDLLDHLRAAFSPQSNLSYDRLFDEVRKAPLLVLDDLGTESATPWAREKLFQLLNYRYTALLPTVITTASTPDEIEPWLRTRMFDVSRCQFYGILAPGYRKSRGPASRPRRSTR